MHADDSPDHSDFPPAFLRLLEERGLSLQGASVRAGSPDLLRKLGKGGAARSIRSDNLGRLATALEITTDELMRLLELPGAPRARPDRARPQLDGLPVLHTCQAGAWFEDDSAVAQDAPLAPFLPDPRWPAPQWLERVRGDSVNKLAPEGSLLQVVAWPTWGSAVPKTGQLVVLERVRYQGGLRERSVKVAQVERSGVSFWPASTNPRWQEPIALTPPAAEETEVLLRGVVVWVHAPGPALGVSG